MTEFTLPEECDYIELIKLLKILNFVSSGGQAKMLVDMGMVKVNDEIEYRKRMKIRRNHIIELQDKKIYIK